ncbi:MAG: DoxX family protein [Candidatus Doudnabacteria bacterium]|nr:DoxX family protein [Candidatus Doudnabacteria bacterium]
MFAKYRNQDLGILIIRLGLAYIFIEHGLQKFTQTHMYAQFFSHLGFFWPLILVYFVGVVEVLGGLAMLLGFFAEEFGWLLAVDMLVVIVKVRMGPQARGWLGGHEFEFMLLLMSVAVSFIGAGRYALRRPAEKQILV